MTVSTSIYDLATTATAKAYLGGDEKADLTPSVSSTYDVRSADWNKMVSGLVENALRTRYGASPCNYLFSQANCTAGQSAVALARSSAGDAAITEIVAPSDGMIVGLTVRSESARSGGTCTINVEVNGTPVTIACVLDGTDTQLDYAWQTPQAAEAAATADTFSAGDLITVTVTTDGSWATSGGTPSVWCDLYLHYGV
jgi:hypothetical protein